ncbi:patatin-like phospholipase family protein [Mitsuaria sp. WAJ17]|uniref:patatin-like phospholipase family protein n=1 Tax=Mitsuaria sp. WAJ17 TaxID=2761452 RepID=UPI00160486E7|nr:patatin-like phospholipase family protein [Mitsuaria sp. WAJ17]MBB2484494.1 patatin-like phospholipase family protein [Mitsuaria sp. WAJ17]
MRSPDFLDSRPSRPSRPSRRTALAALLALGLAACATAPSRNAGTETPPPQPVQPLDPVVPSPPPKPPKLGLALGGGAARGFAHIGVIQVLEENGIKMDLVAGTSAGSLVASLYASGKNGKELAQMAESMDEGAITDWAFPTRGLIRGEALARFVREKTGHRLIEQMPLPLGIVATDLSDGSPILFRTGDTGAAVRASSSVPAVFQPVKIGQREYVDGGLVAPVPVRFAKQMGAELVVAVDISEPPEAKPPGDAMRMLLQTFSIMGRSINNFELREADVIIRPRLEGVGSADFSARKRSIQAGRDAALAALPLLRQRLAAKTRTGR